jgi:hypothetical protein
MVSTQPAMEQDDYEIWLEAEQKRKARYGLERI